MRIALVNDQAMALEALRRAIALRPEHQVVWLARNGAEAVEQCAKAVPDLILMDLLMPVLDGVEATRRIMATTPCAILIVTSSVGANAWRVFEAMGHGALDAVDTPSFGAGQAGAQPLLDKIARVEHWLDQRALGRSGGTALGMAPQQADTTLVAIGASAGGPAALAAILSALPKTFGAAIAVVQHVDAQFAPGMADWLNRSSALNVRVAEEGARLEPGTVLVAGTNDHLILKDARRVGYTPEPADCFYRPSVDVFYHTVAQRWKGPVVGVLLTGMGRDGALGLKVLRNYGHRTLAQDEATSAVYGMPKAAAQLDAADEILPLAKIAPRLVQLANRAG